MADPVRCLSLRWLLSLAHPHPVERLQALGTWSVPLSPLDSMDTMELNKYLLNVCMDD